MGRRLGAALESPRSRGPRAWDRARAFPSPTRVGAQALRLGAAFGGLAGGFELAGATAQEEGERPVPWL